MDVRVEQDSILLKDFDLGKNFSGIRGDLRVDRRGRVRVYRKTDSRKPSFYTDLHLLPVEVLTALSEALESQLGDMILEQVRGRINSLLRNGSEV